jgi:hypothetical protein
MAILQQTTKNAYSSAAPTVTFPGACTPGSKIVVLFNKETLSGTATVADGVNGGNYDVDGFIQGGSGSAGSGGVGIYSMDNTSSATLTVTLTLSGSTVGALIAFELSDTVNFDAVDTDQGQSSVPGVSITTVTANAAVFVVIGRYPGGSMALDSGFTEAFSEAAGSVTYHYGEYDLDVGAAGVKTLNFDTLPTEDNWNMVAVAYAAAGEASPALDEPDWQPATAQPAPLIVGLWG